jgi:hypothetical protein
MKRGDRMIVLGLGLIALLAAFWFLAVAPKREELSEFDDQITALEASVAEQEQLAAFAEEAQVDYDRDYHRLVVLGKAIPGDDDSASLIEQTQTLADDAKIDFRTIVLAAADEAEATAPPPVATETTTDPPPTESTGEGATTTTAGTAPPATAATTPAAPATESAAALLPIGATVGSAGLPVLPYDLTFSGGFFEVADFMSELDGMVRVDSKGIGVDGRLLTVDGFSLLVDLERGLPHLNANLRVTSYVAPADQGLTAGATAAAPAPASGAPVTPTTPTTTSAPGTVTP